MSRHSPFPTLFGRPLVTAAVLLAAWVGSADRAQADCNEDHPDAAGQLAAEVSEAAGAASPSGSETLAQLLALVTQEIADNHGVRPGYAVVLAPPKVEVFDPAQAQLLELSGITRAQTRGGRALALFRPNRLARFRAVVRVNPDGTLDLDRYGRPRIVVEPTGLIPKVAHRAAGARDVGVDIMQHPLTWKAMLLSSISVAAHFATASKAGLGVSVLFGWEGFRAIKGAAGDVSQRRQRVLDSTLEKLKKQAETGPRPTYQEAYQDYLAAMKAEKLSSVLAPEDFFLLLHDEGILLD